MVDIKIDLEGMHYPHIDPRRRQEKRDARMVSEDHNEMANLSNRAIIREFDAWKDVERLG